MRGAKTEKSADTLKDALELFRDNKLTLASLFAKASGYYYLVLLGDRLIECAPRGHGDFGFGSPGDRDFYRLTERGRKALKSFDRGLSENAVRDEYDTRPKPKRRRRP